MARELEIKDKILELKAESGSHSPSIATLLHEIPDLNVEVDACFLSNPYATDLFMEYLQVDLIDSGKLRDVLEFYPPQIKDIRKHISTATKVSAENIFVGNGAIEVIQAVLHKFVSKRICIILPTFSSYYEFVNDDTEVFYYNLQKEDNFRLDVSKYLSFIKKNKINNVVLINPNNPNGNYLSITELRQLIEGLSELDNVIARQRLALLNVT